MDQNKLATMNRESKGLLKQMLESFVNRPLRHDKIMKR